MPAQRTHKLSVRVSKYTDSSGQEKHRSREIGSLFTDENGHMFLRINAEQLNPLLGAMGRQKGDDQVIVGVWPIEAKAASGTPADSEPEPF